MNISIITVCLNSAKTIKDNLISVSSQSHPDLEQIVIDGNSSDNSLDIISAYGQRAEKLVSEPDNGIYEAMNKGLSLASGEIIGVLNADDVYADGKVLETVDFIFKNEPVDACYGDLVYVKFDNLNEVTRYWKAGSFAAEKFYRGWMPPHPAFFFHRRLYETYGGFDLTLGSSADYEIMLRFLLTHRASCRYFPKVFVKMRQGGVSNASLRNRIKAHIMDRKAWRVNGLRPYPWTLPLKPVSKICQFFRKPPEL